MNIAIIDLGTNTFNLIIGNINSNKKFQKTASHRIPVKLGEGTINSSYISEAPYLRGINALKEFKTIIDSHSVQKTIALATSAIRSAKNGNDFVNEALTQTGIAVQTITGDREAELIYLGNREAVQLNNQLSLVMDIGGGSTEFVICDAEKIVWKQSFLLGAARIIEKFKPSDPITIGQIVSIKKFLKEELKPLFNSCESYPPIELIGSSGAFDSVVEMIAYRQDSFVFDENRTSYDVEIKQFLDLYALLLPSTIEERKSIKGLLPMRIDMIVVSSLFIDLILDELKLNKFRVSAYSLKEGVVAEIINGNL